MPVNRKTRRKWNNIIIIVSILMIGTLTLLDRKTSQLPTDSSPLFDSVSMLEQLEFPDVWLNHSTQGWRCHRKVLNCQQWGEAWQNIQLSPIAMNRLIGIEETPIPITIKISNQSQIQSWLWYPKAGLLVTAADNLYQIPPSQRNKLHPILSIS